MVERRPLAKVNFSTDLHDRLSHQRGDPEFHRSAWKAATTRVLVADERGRLAVTSQGGLAYLSTGDAPEGDRLLLGRVGDAVYFLVLAIPGMLGDRAAMSLRELFGGLEAWEASLAVHAVGVANWHRAHPRCARCGGLTEIVGGGESRRCLDCGSSHFPRTDPAVIMLVVDDDDRVLLGHNAQRPDGWFSALAGFVEPGESLEAAVRREVAEEVGLVVDDVVYVGSQPWPLPSSLMLGFFAHTPDPAFEVDGEEITEARWFTRREMLKAAETGAVLLPGGVSIARALVEDWYGGPLPGSW